MDNACPFCFWQFVVSVLFYSFWLPLWHLQTCLIWCLLGIRYIHLLYPFFPTQLEYFFHTKQNSDLFLYQILWCVKFLNCLYSWTNCTCILYLIIKWVIHILQWSDIGTDIVTTVHVFVAEERSVLLTLFFSFRFFFFLLAIALSILWFTASGCPFWSLRFFLLI